MKFYVQLDKENRITDVIEYAYSDYKPVEWETPLPQKILAQCYELVNGQPVYREDWDQSESDRIAELEAQLAEMKAAAKA